jgi:hypothetical protein
MSVGLKYLKRRMKVHENLGKGFLVMNFSFFSSVLFDANDCKAKILKRFKIFLQINKEIEILL